MYVVLCSRLGFDVDMSSFSRPADLDVDSVIREMSSGDGFVILRGLFTQGEIRSAKETVMYLVRKEGRKATHFQVGNYYSYTSFYHHKTKLNGFCQATFWWC